MIDLSVGQAVFGKRLLCKFSQVVSWPHSQVAGAIVLFDSLNDGVVVCHHADQIQVHFNVATDSNQI